MANQKSVKPLPEFIISPEVTVIDGNKLQEAQIAAAITALKKKLVSSITPELFRREIDNINKSNTDADRSRLSRAEAVALLKSNFATSPEMSQNSEEGRQMTTVIGNICVGETDPTKLEEVMAPILSFMGRGSKDAIEFHKAMAKAIDMGGKDAPRLIEEQGAKVIKLMGQLPITAQATPAQQVQIKTLLKGMFEEVGQRTKDVLAKEPALRQDLSRLPDVSELGNLNADDACNAFLSGVKGKTEQKTRK